jgi:hypothetical protein
MLSSNVYNVLKVIATTVLPGLGALYFALADIWNLPKAEEVVGTIAAVNVFLGLLVNVSSVQYNRSDKKYGGVINTVDREDGSKVFTLELADEVGVYDLEKRDSVLFRIRNRK